MHNPIEQLAMRYIRSVEGDYEQVEPQVYDIMLPEPIVKELQLPVSQGLCRVAFDTEALADHSHAQLLTFGHPALDQIFAMAHQQGVLGRIFISGLNLRPHQLLSKLKQHIRIGKEL